MSEIFAYCKKSRLCFLLALIVIAGICSFLMPQKDYDLAATEEDEAMLPEEASSTICYAVPQQRVRPIKDPFASPELAAKTLLAHQPDKSQNAAKPVPNSTEPPALPLLTGTIKSGDSFIGLMRFEKSTKAVRCGDFIGAFRVVSIDESSLTLADARQNFFICKLKGL